MTKRLLTASLLATMLLAGCSTQDDPANTSSAVPSSSGPTSSQAPAEASGLLDEYGLDGKGTVEIIDHLDRLDTSERPSDLVASVRPHELALSSGPDEVILPIPEDRFYLAVAPYTDQTHDCFHHSLTTCTGELASTDIRVEVVDETHGKVLVDETRTTFENGFTGFWLPRDIEGSVRVTTDGRSGEAQFSTGQDAPTCLTTLRLA